MLRCIAFAVIMAAGGAICIAQDAQPDIKALEAQLARYAPEQVGEWQRQGDFEFYEEDNLWEYINGAAPQYIDYGFQLVAACTYATEDKVRGSLILDLYHMGSRMNAFGLWANGESERTEPVEIGEHCFRAGPELHLARQEVYAKVTPTKQKADVGPAVEAMVRAVAEKIGKPEGPLPLVDQLPREGLLPRTTRYYAKDGLGQAALVNAVAGRYRLGEAEAELLISNLPDEQAARKAYESFRGELAKRNGELAEVAGVGDEAHRVKDKYYGLVALCRAGARVLVATRLSEAEVGERLIRAATKPTE